MFVISDTYCIHFGKLQYLWTYHNNDNNDTNFDNNNQLYVVVVDDDNGADRNLKREDTVYFNQW